jgi:methylated-DNA-protein-cysteine methyltransferase-like protein
MDPKSYKAFGARWVGGAMAACPQDVPWQRIINSKGKVSLHGVQQRELLESEGVVFDEHDRVDLKKYTWSDENSEYSSNLD